MHWNKAVVDLCFRGTDRDYTQDFLTGLQQVVIDKHAKYCKGIMISYFSTTVSHGGTSRYCTVRPSPQKMRKPVRDD